MRRFQLLAPVVVVTVTLAGCGGSNRSSDSSAPPNSRPTSAGDTTSADTTTSSPTPAGCSQFCAQAGPVGGDSPRDATQVLHCTSSCITQITKSADVVNGVVSIEVRCDAPVPCEGAIVVYTGVFKRLGGADFSLESGATGTVDVGLVDNWQDLIAASNNRDAAIFIWLVGPGNEPLIAGGESLTLTQTP